LTQPKNALINTRNIPMDDVEFTINDEALDFSRQGLEYKLGARGLRSL
jgi:ATP-dependent protease Clp ATPase subunit